MAEIKIIKKLGEGYEGEVFLIKKNNISMIRKIFRVGPFVDRMDLTSPFWREAAKSKKLKYRSSGDKEIYKHITRQLYRMNIVH
jgi:hypothetical protein